MKPFEPLSSDTFLLRATVSERPLALPLLFGDDGVMLLDTGCAPHVQGVILPALRDLKVASSQLRWIVNTHCDADHQGGNYGMKQFAPRALLCCGDADREQVE